MKKYILATISFIVATAINAQSLTFKKQEFELKHVTASIEKVKGKKAIKVERDLEALPFDLKNLGSTVDEPTYVKLKNVTLANGTIEVKLLSRVQANTTFKGAQGFIGVAFRINDDDSAYESIYLRPRVGRSDSQFARNRTVQYYAYPDHKFDVLRNETKKHYETAAPIALDEWITMRLEIKDKKVKMFLNNEEYATMVIDEMLGSTKEGAIALWVDIGTEGYFRDLKVIQE